MGMMAKYFWGILLIVMTWVGYKYHVKNKATRKNHLVKLLTMTFYAWRIEEILTRLLGYTMWQENAIKSTKADSFGLWLKT